MDVVINSDCSALPDSNSSKSTQGSVLLNFLDALNYDPNNPPAADLLRKYHHLDGNWLIVSPVHWQATHNSAHIVATAKELALTETESRRLFQHYSEYLAEEGMTLYYHDSELWLLCANNKSTLNAKPVYHLLNKPFMAELSEIDHTLYWQKFITESQMFFATHNETSFSLSTSRGLSAGSTVTSMDPADKPRDVGVLRGSASNPTINGIWLWGSGPLGPKKSIPVCADEKYFSLAQIISSEVTEYSESIVLKDYQLLLIDDYSLLSESHKEQLKKMAVTWYWNNSVYSKKKHNWFTGLLQCLSGS